MPAVTRSMCKAKKESEDNNATKRTNRPQKRKKSDEGAIVVPPPKRKGRKKIPALYKRFFVDKNDERLDLFQKIVDKYNVKTGIYPGSFTHITPSFVIPEMVYIDMDKRCKSFFNDKQTMDYVASQRTYDAPPIYRFYESKFENAVDETDHYFDVMVSFYAGIISKHCKRYLKRNGYLLTNNSHGDAAIAQLDSDYELTAVVQRKGDRFTISESDLNTYFITQSGKPIDAKQVQKKMKGPAYTKPAFAYVFRKV